MGRGSVMASLCLLKALWLDPRVKPEDDSAR